MGKKFGYARATLTVLIFTIIGPLMGGLSFIAVSRVALPLDLTLFKGLPYWAFVYAYGTLSAAAVGGIIAAYGGERLQLRVAAIASVIVGIAFCIVVLRHDNIGRMFSRGEFRLPTIFITIHFMAGVLSLAVAKLLLRL